MKLFKKFTLKTFTNKGYALTAIELKDAISFEVKRVYFLTNIPSNATAGNHCHKVEEEVFVMQQGGCVAIIDRGQGKEEMPMKADDAFYIPAWCWHGFKNFSSDAVLMALSSTNYEASREDYVEDYEVYKNMVQSKQV